MAGILLGRIRFSGRSNAGIRRFEHGFSGGPDQDTLVPDPQLLKVTVAVSVSLLVIDTRKQGHTLCNTALCIYDPIKNCILLILLWDLTKGI